MGPLGGSAEALILKHTGNDRGPAAVHAEDYDQVEAER